MAIKLAITLPTNIQADYWRIISCRVDFVSKVAEIDVALYKDQDSRDSGADYISVKTYNFRESTFPFTQGALSKLDALTIAYEAIKGESLFISAVDVIEVVGIDPMPIQPIDVVDATPLIP